jgi:prophage regulatory protein
VAVDQPPRILRTTDVQARTGLSRTSIWRLQRAGDFPSSRRLSPGTVGWLEGEVSAWIETRDTKGTQSPAVPSARARSRGKANTIAEKTL